MYLLIANCDILYANLSRLAKDETVSFAVEMAQRHPPPLETYVISGTSPPPLPYRFHAAGGRRGGGGVPERRLLRVPAVADVHPADGAHRQRPDPDARHAGGIRVRDNAVRGRGVRAAHEPVRVRRTGAGELRRRSLGRHRHRRLLSRAVPGRVHQLQEERRRRRGHRLHEARRRLSAVRRVLVHRERGARLRAAKVAAISVRLAGIPPPSCHLVVRVCFAASGDFQITGL